MIKRTNGYFFVNQITSHMKREHTKRKGNPICLLLVLTYYTLIPCLYCALRPLSKPLFMSILTTELKSPTFVNLHGKPCCRVV